MDIIGAINHNFELAGLRARNRVINTPQGQLVEVGFMLPTRPKPTLIRARVPVSQFDVVGDEVGAKGKKLKPRQKIKKALKKATGKALKTLTRVAAPVANMMAPGSGTALKAGVALLGKATQLKRKAKSGDKKAAKLMQAPIKVKPTPGKAITPPKPKGKPQPQPKGRPAPRPPIRAAAPKPKAAPRPAPLRVPAPAPRRVAPSPPPQPDFEEAEVMDPEEASIEAEFNPELDASEAADFGEFGDADPSLDDADPSFDASEEFGEGDGGELDEGEAVAGLDYVGAAAGIYTVKTPKGKVVRVKLP